MRLIKVGGVFMIAVAVVVHDEKHIHAESYHGESQPTRPLESVVSTATATAKAIRMFKWDLMDFR